MKERKENFLFRVIPTQLALLTTHLQIQFTLLSMKERKKEKRILFRVISNSTCSTNNTLTNLFYSLRKKGKKEERIGEISTLEIV